MDPRPPRSVLLLSQLPPPYGGLSVHTERLRETLRARGLEVDVLSPPVEAPAGSALSRRLRSARNQVRFLARLLRAPADVVHDHISTYAIGQRGWVAIGLHLALLAVLRARRRPWVLTCGNGLLPGLLAQAPPLLRRLYRTLYAGVSVGIAKNAPILDAFRELGLGDRSRIVGTFLAPVSAPGARSLPDAVVAFFRAHPRCVTSAGFRFEPLYHLDAVVRAVAALRARGASDLGLVLLGSRQEDPAGTAALDLALSETCVSSHVLVLRDVDFALDVVARSALFVRATDFDGDANTVKEAMLVGVPVLATDLPGRPPGVQLFAKGAFDELAPRMAALLDRPESETSRRNRAWVENDIAGNTEAILSAYREACGA